MSILFLKYLLYQSPLPYFPKQCLGSFKSSLVFTGTISVAFKLILPAISPLYLSFGVIFLKCKSDSLTVLSLSLIPPPPYWCEEKCSGSFASLLALAFSLHVSCAPAIANLVVLLRYILLFHDLVTYCISFSLSESPPFFLLLVNYFFNSHFWHYLRSFCWLLQVDTLFSASITCCIHFHFNNYQVGIVK